MPSVKRWSVWACGGILVASAVQVALVLVLAHVARHPELLLRDAGAHMARPLHTDPQRYAELAYDDVDIEVEDGEHIRGWWVHGSEQGEVRHTCIIGVHGAFEDRREHLHAARGFSQGGMPVLLYDTRGRGQSLSEAFRGLGYSGHEWQDVLEACRWVRMHHTDECTHVVASGMSNGAASALRAAAHDGARCLDGVIAQSGFGDAAALLQTKTKEIVRGGRSGTFATLGRAGPLLGAVMPWLFPDKLINATVDLALWMARSDTRGSVAERVRTNVRVPLLLAHAKGDPLVPYSHALQLLEAAHTSERVPYAELWSLNDHVHAELSQRMESEFHRRVRAFITSHVHPKFGEQGDRLEGLETVLLLDDDE